MANVTVFDPITRNTNTILVTLESAVIDTDNTSRVDHFIQLSTAAKKISGAAIESRIIRRLTDLVRLDENGKPEFQHNGFTSTPYETMSKAIEDYILNMIEGDGGTDAMAF